MGHQAHSARWRAAGSLIGLLTMCMLAWTIASHVGGRREPVRVESVDRPAAAASASQWDEVDERPVMAGKRAVTVHRAPRGFQVVDAFTSGPDGVFRDGVKVNSPPIEQSPVTIIRLADTSVAGTNEITIAFRNQPRSMFDDQSRSGAATELPSQAGRHLYGTTGQESGWAHVVWSQDDGGSVWVNGRGLPQALLQRIADALEVREAKGEPADASHLWL